MHYSEERERAVQRHAAACALLSPKRAAVGWGAGGVGSAAAELPVPKHHSSLAACAWAPSCTALVAACGQEVLVWRWANGGAEEEGPDWAKPPPPPTPIVPGLGGAIRAVAVASDFLIVTSEAPLGLSASAVTIGS